MYDTIEKLHKSQKNSFSIRSIVLYLLTVTAVSVGFLPGIQKKRQSIEKKNPGG
jgi:hypothetical protein